MPKKAGAMRFLIFCGDFGSRVVLQAAYFIFISRALGVAGLGTFAAITPITTLAACFSGLATDQVAIVKSASPDFDISDHFGRTLTSTLATFLPLLVLTLAACVFSARGQVTIPYILSVAVSDIIFTRLVSLSASLLYIKNKIFLQFIVNIVPFICKVTLAAGAYFTFSNINLNVWCLLYAIGGFVGGVNAYIMLILVIGRPKFKHGFHDLYDGFLYSLEFASLAAFRDMDKPVVNFALGASSTGAYTAAFRVVDTICVPIRAFLQSTYIQYFTAAQESRKEALRYSVKSAGVVALIGLVLAIILLPISPFIPRILGNSYSATVSVICLMAPYPILLGLTGVGSDALRALGLQKARLLTLTVTYVAYLPCIYLGSEWFGLNGAAIARIFVQAIAVALTWAVVYWATRRETSRPILLSESEEVALS